MAEKNDMGTISNGDQLNEGYFNESFNHNFTISTATTATFTPKNASHLIFIMAKASVTKAASTVNGTATLSSDEDGTLDTMDFTYETGGGTSEGAVALLYGGTLTVTAHTISMTTSDGSLQQPRILITEYLP